MRPLSPRASIFLLLKAHSFRTNPLLRVPRASVVEEKDLDHASSLITFEGWTPSPRGLQRDRMRILIIPATLAPYWLFPASPIWQEMTAALTISFELPGSWLAKKTDSPLFDARSHTDHLLW